MKRQCSVMLMQNFSLSVAASSRQAPALDWPCISLWDGPSSWSPSFWWCREYCAELSHQTPQWTVSSASGFLLLRITKVYQRNTKSQMDFPISGHRWGCICLLAPKTCSDLMELILSWYTTCAFGATAEAILWGKLNAWSNSGWKQDNIFCPSRLA